MTVELCHHCGKPPKEHILLQGDLYCPNKSEIDLLGINAHPLCSTPSFKDHVRCGPICGEHSLTNRICTRPPHHDDDHESASYRYIKGKVVAFSRWASLGES